METYPTNFPPGRQNDPKRKAEARVFDELRRSRLPGFTYYEWQRDHRSPQLDFPVWISGVGRFGLEVKGGHYLLRQGKWHLMTANGSAKKDSPVRKTFDATMSLHDEVVDTVDTLRRDPFFIAVLVFPDMEPDQAIADNAKRNNVHVIWGVDGLIDKLQEIAAETEVYNPPDEEDIAREVAAVTDGQALYEPQADRLPRGDGDPLPPGIAPRPPMEVAAGNITIQHVDVLNVYTVSVGTPEAGKVPVFDMPGDEADPAEE